MSTACTPAGRSGPTRPGSRAPLGPTWWTSGSRRARPSAAEERIAATGDPFGLGADRDAFIVAGTTLFFTDAATRALAADVGVAFRRLVQELEPLAGPLPATMPPRRCRPAPGSRPSSLGLENHARRLARSLIDLAGPLGITRIVERVAGGAGRAA